MIEPRRMREEGGSALEQALLEAGRSAGASPRTRTRTLAALGLAAGPLVIAAAPTQAAGVLAAATEAAPATATAGATTALTTKLALTGTLTKVVATVTLAGAIAAVPLGTMAWRRLHPAPRAEATLSTGSTTAVAASVERAPPEVARPAAAKAPADSLSRELTALDTARLRLAKGDTTGAQAALDQYGRSFPRGRLAMEAEVLRIDALARGGRTAAARSRAAAFLRNHPGSVLTPRVRQYLGD
jgi:hypothetical protein